MAPPAIAVQFTLRWLLGARRAALLSIDSQETADRAAQAISAPSVWPEILAWLAATYGCIVPVIVPSLIILAIMFQTGRLASMLS